MSTQDGMRRRKLAEQRYRDFIASALELAGLADRESLVHNVALLTPDQRADAERACRLILDVLTEARD